MLIRCTNCEKLFDYDACNGICPDCGRYHDAPSELPRTAPMPHVSAEGVQPMPAKAKNVRASAIALMILWAAIALCGFVYIRLQEARWASSGLYPDNPVDTVYYEEFSLRGRRAKLGPCELMGPAFSTEDLAEGDQLVRVHFEVEESPEYAMGLEDEPFLRADGPDGISTYLHPLSEYDIENYFPELTPYLLTSYDFSSMSEESGWFYFAIPQDTEKVYFHMDLGQDMHSSQGWFRAANGAYLAELPMAAAETAESEGTVNG